MKDKFFPSSRNVVFLSASVVESPANMMVSLLAIMSFFLPEIYFFIEAASAKASRDFCEISSLEPRVIQVPPQAKILGYAR